MNEGAKVYSVRLRGQEHWDCSQEPQQLRIRLACMISTKSKRLVSAPEGPPSTRGRGGLSEGRMTEKVSQSISMQPFHQPR